MTSPIVPTARTRPALPSTTAGASSPAPGCDALWGSCCVVGDPQRELTGRTPWLRLAIGMFIAAQTMVLALAVNLTPPEDVASRLVLQGSMLGVTLLVVALLGGPLFIESARALWSSRLTMEMLFLLTLLGALGMSVQAMVTGEGDVYFEVVSILLIVYSIGRAISQVSRQRALRTVQGLAESLRRVRRVSDIDGASPAIVEAEDIEPGDLVLVMPGEFIPVDGRIARGVSFVRETAFTGEWMAATRHPGDTVLAGAANEDGLLVITATAGGERRRVIELAQRIEEARLQPTSLQRQADRFVAWFLPLVMAASIGTFAYWLSVAGPQVAIYHALAVLLVSCPCAAGLATPLVLWTVIGRLAGHGLVLRGGDVIERLATADSAVFDKTGTLGDEVLEVETIAMADGASADRTETLAILAALERHGDHPVARAIRGALPQTGSSDASLPELTELRVLAGRGIEGLIRRSDGRVECATLVRDDDATAKAGGGVLVLALQLAGRTVARVHLRERFRETCRTTLLDVQKMGLSVRVMTGDGEGAAQRLADVATVHAAMTPDGKRRLVEELRATRPDFTRPVFVGDGFNDAAAMAVSQVSIAMAGGSEIARESADATLHGPDLSIIPRAIEVSRQAVRTIRANLHFAVTYNITGIALAASGWLHPIAAALLMAVSSALVSIRSFRVVDSFPEAFKELKGIPEAIEPAQPSPADEIARKLQAARGESDAPTPLAVSQQRRLAFLTQLHSLGLVLQGWVLSEIAGLSGLGQLGLIAVFGAAALAMSELWKRLPPWADMTWGMVTLGGFGMNLGWWADFGFHTAEHAVTVGMGICPNCTELHSGAVATASIGWLNYMNAGMLLLGVPAMYLARHTPEPFNIRRWCCGGMLLLGVPGMVLGMMAGSKVVAVLLPAASFPVLAGAHYVGMMVGMVLGMLIPHALEYAFPRSWRNSSEVA